MARGLTHYGRQLLVDPAKLRQSLDVPLLVWEAPPEANDEHKLFGTMSGAGPRRPTSGDPLVFELKKGAGLQNAFGFGITVGRTENNDVHVDDNSVSRFHAHFQKDARGTWTLTDAESKNGTFVDGKPLSPRGPVELSSGSRLKFGDVELLLLWPEAFVDFVNRKMAA